MSLIGFKARNHKQQVAKRGSEDKTDDRATRLELFEPLNVMHKFTLDVAASKDNAKCSSYFTKEQNGLIQSWANETVWCNPPYSNLKDWVTKAIREVTENDCPKVVMLLPANRCEQAWWQDYIEPTRDKTGLDVNITTAFLRGRHRFDWPRERVVSAKGDRPPFGLVIVTICKDQKEQEND